MIKIIGNDLTREGTKLGWIQGNDILNAAGLKLGFFSGNDIYDRERHKIAWLEAGKIKFASGVPSWSVPENNKHIIGGAYSDVCRAAIRVLLGD